MYAVILEISLLWKITAQENYGSFIFSVASADMLQKYAICKRRKAKHLSKSSI